MNQRFSDKDYEMISDYLDQCLSRDDIPDFAKRLSEDPELSSETEELMRVKVLAHEIPELTPPHNYILTTAEAREARRPGILERLFPFFRTAAAFCCFALIASFVIPQMQLSSLRNEEASAAKYIQLDEMVLEESVDEIFREDYEPEEKNTASETETTYSMPSFGVRGGTPKNEFMMDAERMIPGSGNAEMNQPDAVILLEEVPPIPEKNADPLPLIRTVFLGAVLISAVWILLTVLRRNRLKLKD